MVSPVFGAVLAGIIISIGLLITRIYGFSRNWRNSTKKNRHWRWTI